MCCDNTSFNTMLLHRHVLQRQILLWIMDNVMLLSQPAFLLLLLLMSHSLRKCRKPWCRIVELVTCWPGLAFLWWDTPSGTDISWQRTDFIIHYNFSMYKLSYWFIGQHPSSPCSHMLRNNLLGLIILGKFKAILKQRRR